MSLLADKTQGPVLVGAHTDSGAAFVPDQSRAERKRSYAVADFTVPNGREEDWRFTPVDRLRPLFEVGPDDRDGVTVTADTPDGVTVSHGTPGSVGLGVGIPADRASAVAWESASVMTSLAVAPGAAPAEPAVLRVTGHDKARLNGHLAISAGAHSRSVVVVAHAGSVRCGANVEIDVEDGAELTLVSVQEWDDDSLHVAQHDARIGRDASLRHIVVTLGGAIVRISTNVLYSGTGGSFEGLGVYFADAGQHLEHRLFVDHEPPNCRSDVAYKGALQGDGAHTVWVGDVLIRASAGGTNTYELNRNLVLTDGARADSVPNLEIETGQIEGAGHASATGRFDDEQLFYLQARGIPEDTARRLVVRGFFASIVQRIGVPEIVERIMAAIDRELGATPQTEADG
ncbi:conserved hypothetical protein [Nostocoides japonicum T1-X7]|uniref:SUF system FeS cluster assembly SufBD core domain-containing protein n=1 Tax=Nostocoides japonicum T1-X7 TaxID=1194083 RepID=A0A077M1L8_9MICO|nr:Fe-S cluster assembly protein SufD [Tetrasphaera japonica]CCH79736.1 conserved hypothetical protein [Tetrasphaera japonica T1-X7]